jgi:ATP-binding cassette subfamily C protein CydC
VTAAASPIRALVRRERQRQGGRLAIAALSAAGTAAAAVTLLGLSGWFLSAAALAGAGGPVAAAAFNYLLPSAGIRFLAIARTGLRYAERLVGHAAALKALAEIRPALFAGLAAAPVERGLGLSSGEATARLVQDIDAIESLFVRLSTPWAVLASTLAAAALAAMAGWRAVLVLFGVLTIQIAAGAWIGLVRSRAPAGEVLRATGALKDQLQAYAAASAELRCHGLTGIVIDQLMAADARLADARRRGWAALAEIEALQPLLAGAAAAAVLAASVHAPPALAALAALSAVVALEGTGGLMQAFERRGAVEAAAERLDRMLCARAPSGPTPDPGPGASIILVVANRVNHLASGGRWSLSGPSGAGKTRLLESLVGLRSPSVGHIAIDGRDLADMPLGAGRGLFAYAPQDARMISGTVRENLALGDPGADDATMWRALETAQLEEKVQRLPGGLDTWIGEGGASLSGGERRRLALARALLRPAPWLLLDEPTEGLDAVTEARVIRALSVRLAESGQGLILVSHRPAAMVLADHRIDIEPAPRARSMVPA